MPLFLDTRGQPTLGIGICDRCSRKFKLADLYSDPNAPGLRVCLADRDEYDPYRLPVRQPDNLRLPFYRPDVSVATHPAGAITDDGLYFIVTDDQLYYIVP